MIQKPAQGLGLALLVLGQMGESIQRVGIFAAAQAERGGQLARHVGDERLPTGPDHAGELVACFLVEAHCAIPRQGCPAQSTRAASRIMRAR